ncbi:MAG: hypothetical protein IPO22_13245 [Anaerolineales bacterium]|nr:hypothetical protein [Anaerolineales bacterium]
MGQHLQRNCQGIVYGIAFVFYTLALIHPLRELAEIARDGLKRYDPV